MYSLKITVFKYILLFIMLPNIFVLVQQLEYVSLHDSMLITQISKVADE